MTDLAIRARGLGKRYRHTSPEDRHNSLADALVAGVKTLGRRARPEAFWALRDVSFDIRHGESVAVLGLNGAGKSTLLKLLSRITEPTEGAATINGRLGSLLEVGTGFHAELTGRENIFLYGAILGMEREEIAAKFDAIVDFSGIGEFINTPVKRYSSGMYVRLAFSVAAQLEPDIMLLDEVLAVGDITFQKKCIDFARAMQRRDATILLVSHNMANIRSMCDRVIYLRQGRVAFDGPMEEGVRLYEADCRLSTYSWSGLDEATSPIGVTELTLMDAVGLRRPAFARGQQMRIRIDYEIREDVTAPNFMVVMVRSDDLSCCNFSSEIDGVVVEASRGPGQIELVTPPLKLVAGDYRAAVLVREKGFGRLLCAQVGEAFKVVDPLINADFGAFHEAGQWRETERAHA